MLVFKGEDVAVVVVVACACGGVAADGVVIVVAAGAGCLRDEAAVAVVAQVSGGLAVMVVLDGVHAAVLAVPDEFAVGVGDDGGSRVAVAVQDVWRGAWAVAVLVVVLDDQATIGGFAQDFAVAIVGGDVFGGGVGGVGDVGFGGCGCVVHAGGLRLQDWRGVHVVGFRGGAAQGVQVVAAVGVGGGFAVRFGKGGQVGSEGEQEGDGDVFVVHGGYLWFWYWASRSAAACCSAFLRLLPCAVAR